MIGKKSCQMAKNQKCTLQFDRKTASVEFCQHAVLDWDFKQSGSQIHAWILLKKNYICQFLFCFFQIKLLSLSSRHTHANKFPNGHIQILNKVMFDAKLHVKGVS